MNECPECGAPTKPEPGYETIVRCTNGHIYTLKKYPRMGENEHE